MNSEQERTSRRAGDDPLVARTGYWLVGSAAHRTALTEASLHDSDGIYRLPHCHPIFQPQLTVEPANSRHQRTGAD
jgi:hypothetical protein